jgi:hypothetical protein
VTRRAIVFLFALGAFLRAAQQEDPASTHRAYLWRAEGLVPSEEDRKSLAALGVVGFDAEGPAGVAQVKNLGAPFYVDHGIPKGFLHVRRQDFHTRRTDFLRNPTPEKLVRVPCLRDPKALAEAKDRLRATLDALGEATPDFFSLGDECSVTRGVSPFDSCRCDDCLSELPKFLAARWGGPAAARAAWGARYPESGPPDPPTTDEARAAAFYGAGGPETVVAWSDFRAFVDDGFTKAVRELANDARKRRPDLRVGLLGCSSPSAFGGYDWEKLAPWLDAVEVYDHGGLRALAGGLCGPRTLFVSTATPTIDDPDLLRYRLWRRFLRGDVGVVLFWSKDWCLEGDPSRPSPLLRAMGPTFLEMAGLALEPWRKAVPAPPLAVVWHSADAVRADWLLETRDDGAAWVNRLTSYENASGAAARARESWIALLEDLGFSPTFASTPRFKLDRVALAHASVLVLSRACAVSEIDRHEIKEFAEGRLLVGDELAGLFSHRFETLDPPAFDALFGVERKRRGFATAASRPSRDDDGLPPPSDDALGVKQGFAERLVGATPTFVKGAAEGRRTLYLNASLQDYRDDRLARPERAAALRRAVEPHFAAVRKRSRPYVEGPFDPRSLPVALHVRTRGLDQFVVALEVNALTSEAPPSKEALERIREAPPSRVRLRMPTLVDGVDLRTGAALGSGVEFEVESTFGNPRILVFTNR